MIGWHFQRFCLKVRGVNINQETKKVTRYGKTCQGKIVIQSLLKLSTKSIQLRPLTTIKCYQCSHHHIHLISNYLFFFFRPAKAEAGPVRKSVKEQTKTLNEQVNLSHRTKSGKSEKLALGLSIEFLIGWVGCGSFYSNHIFHMIQE